MAHSKSIVAPYFGDLEQQQDTNMLGMWVFLVTEVMLFGGIFLVYAVYFYNYLPAFHEASLELDVVLSTINTFVLLCSSLTMAMAVRSAQLSKQNALVLFLILTFILGGVFLGIKGYEYYEKWTHHLIPGPNFHFEGQYAQQAALFFALYFAATGLHATHMIIGGTILLILIVKAIRGAYSAANFDVIENMGLYWHFVDIAWVFIFPLFYLIER
ncbi:MAG TPA: cytochrome c oxidase subunit 3 [Anaerolineae bacterium]|nr:cytochrome c oxidase subunit 3 [Anaerolineae bacterium]HMR62784.1 cytochrome c oxidase subunit 3 [Anaerolineae bacterium]